MLEFSTFQPPPSQSVHQVQLLTAISFINEIESSFPQLTVGYQNKTHLWILFKFFCDMERNILTQILVLPSNTNSSINTFQYQIPEIIV